MSDDAITLIRRSAKGDLEAHRALADLAIAAGREATGKGMDAFIPYYEASIFARMAAASGLMPDRARLMAVLAICAELASESDEADVYSAEGIALAELVADTNEGFPSEYAAQMIVNNAGDSSPQVLEMAKEFKMLWGCE